MRWADEAGRRIDHFLSLSDFASMPEARVDPADHELWQFVAQGQPPDSRPGDRADSRRVPRPELERRIDIFLMPFLEAFVGAQLGG
jgi:hypothetical protein